ncbi:Predicted CobN/magnesium chelatase [gamma proteobacterium HdN1]|nr:Predicted CobN/magnesium chelatase [gamma proteobacterium HdN1]
MALGRSAAADFSRGQNFRDRYRWFGVQVLALALLICGLLFSSYGNAVTVSGATKLIEEKKAAAESKPTVAESGAEREKKAFAATDKPKVLVLAAAPIQRAKFDQLMPIAEKAGFLLESRMLDQPNSMPTDAEMQRYQLTVIDAAYGPAIPVLQKQIGAMLAKTAAPWFWNRRDASVSGNVDEKLREKLHAYYSNGGLGNFEGFFCVLANEVRHAGRDCVDPVIYPDAGIYHPLANGQVFTQLEEFLQWKSQNGHAVANNAPVVAILFHKGYMDSGLTALLDATVEKIEAQGAIAVPVYAPAMTSGDISKLVTHAGKPSVDVIINMQIMLNASARKDEFEKLGAPVLQVISYSRGDQAKWEKDAQGMDVQDIPFYLAQPEYAGLTDPMFAGATLENDSIVPIQRQLNSVVEKAMRLAALRHKARADVKTAIMFYNYPPGEKNLGASFMNVPQSLENLLSEYKKRGYQVDLQSEDQLIKELTGLLSPFYRPETLAKLIKQDRAGRLPLADYQRWFTSLPKPLQEDVNQRWGSVEQAGLLLSKKGERFFVIPRLRLGNQIIMPQPPRSEHESNKEKALYHDTKVPPSHSYLAAYLWLREVAKVDALVHFGTHGSAEWQPGKERGLDVNEYPFLVLGDLPVVYPYIVDNIGEALQTKRRGRATVISHNTPSFGPAGLHNDLNKLHDLLHTWTNMTEGEVRSETAEHILKLAVELKLDKDLGIDLVKEKQDFTHLVDTLHIHLHELALQQQPLGLARFGVAAETDLRLLTVQQMLGKPLLQALFPNDPEEVMVVDYEKIRQTPVWNWLDQHIRKQQPLAANQQESDPALAALLEKGLDYWKKLSDNHELDGYFSALQGKYIATSYGGDPIKNPESLPTGRNLYGFDPSRIPTQEAWEAGKVAAERLLEQHKESKGTYPDKLAFTLWSVETMRHFGLLEAQVFALLGYKPVWNSGGRVVGIEVIPASELKRPRVDVVVSATGLYRDQFPQVMKWIAEAADQASKIEEPDNAVAINTRRIEKSLLSAGMSKEDASLAARTRIFSSESGAYSTGLDDATLASDSFGETKEGKQDRSAGEAKLAKLYLDRMQFAYGPDASRWGEKMQAGTANANLFAEQLRGVKGAVLSRSSNLYGMLTTDDPFQYLGGIGLAVRHLDGQSPELYISNLRDAKNPKSETASGFLARDLRTRYLHPGWIKQMQKEGYSGALQVLGSVNNLWGWEVVSPETVRDDQWQEYKEVYVDDKYKLNVNEWFEKNHPTAQAQLIERMLEAARKEYWKTDAATLQQLAERYQELAERYDVQTENQRFKDFVKQAAAGYGLAAPAPQANQSAPQEAPAESAPKDAPTQQVQGQKLEKQSKPEPAEPVPFDFTALFALALMLLAFVGGIVRQARSSETALS